MPYPVTVPCCDPHSGRVTNVTIADVSGAKARIASGGRDALEQMHCVPSNGDYLQTQE